MTAESQTLGICRARSVLIARVDLPGVEPIRLEPGPLPLPLGEGEPTNEATRRTYLSSRAAEVLYGEGRRWHSSEAKQSLGRLTVEAIELLNPTGGPSLALVHVVLPHDDPVGALAWAVKVPSRSGETQHARVELDGVLDSLVPGLSLAGKTTRLQTVGLLTFARPSESVPVPQAPASWSATQAWLWLLASATPLEAYPPDPAHPDPFRGLIHLSASWRALVLRDGVSFVSLEADKPGGFLDRGEVYVQTVYTDTFVLALIQRWRLDDLADRLAEIGSRGDKRDELRALGSDVTQFRNSLWWEDVTGSGVANEILLRAQDQLRTASLFERVVSDVRSFAEEVEAQAAQDSLRIQERSERRLTVVGIGVALCALVLAWLSVPINGLTTSDEGIHYGWLVAVTLVAFLAGVLGGWSLYRLGARRRSAAQGD